MTESQRDRRAVRQRVQLEAGAWGTMSAIHSAFVNPMLVDRGAGPVALGIYNSGANLFGLGAGFWGPRFAARAGSVSRVMLASLLAARLIFIGIPVILLLTGTGAVGALILTILLWTAGEGIALPLWTSLLAGLVGPAQRGRWLATRAAVAAGVSAVVLLATLVLLQLLATETTLRIAYVLAALAGLASVGQLRGLTRITPPVPVPPVRSARHFPAAPAARQFLGGVFCFWFGAGLIWPVLTPYIIHHLHAPTAYFGAVGVLSAVIGVVVQRRWGQLGDSEGARAVLALSSYGSGLVPLLWALVPVYYLGIPVEIVASTCWPGHLLGLTLRGVELARDEAERPELLAWTNLAQGAGACVAPLIAAAAVGSVGTVPILIAAGLIRIAGATVIGEPRRLPLSVGILIRRRSRRAPPA